MTARTRRQKAALTTQTDEKDVAPSGNGTVSKTPKEDAPPKAEKGVKENVFLFAPNLIGEDSPPPFI